ncbi:MAG: peptidylprolyl isomerase [Acidobacteriota bacterium]
MKRRALTALLAVGVLVFSPQALAKSRKKKGGKSSAVIATINGEPVTKAEWSAVWKTDQWLGPQLKKEAGFADKMSGRSFEDFFFREEIVKIRVMKQKYKDALPAMKAAIDRIYQEAKAGADFAELARKYSQDPGSAKKGGDLGAPKELHEMVFPFNRIMMKTKQGQISEPLLTIFGYHILKVDRIFPAIATEGKGKRVAVRNILIRYPSADAREEAEQLADAAEVKILDKKLCKRLVSYCSAGS